MRKVILGVLLGTFVGGMFVWGADAQRRNRRRQGNAARTQQQQEEQAPTTDSAGITEAMAGVQWGWTKDQTLDHFRNQIRERFRPEIAKAMDAMTEDRLRADMGTALRKLSESYVCFQGRRSTWEASFIRYEFTHGNGECLLVKEDGEAQNFYFFIGDRLWKWYRAPRDGAPAARRFDAFVDGLQEKFGRGRRAEGELVSGGEPRTYVEWQDAHTRVRAVDESRFYGFFSLVFEDRGTVAQLATLRRAQPQAVTKRSHALVDAVTREPDPNENPDSNPDIVDRITGKIRNRPDLPERNP